MERVRAARAGRQGSQGRCLALLLAQAKRPGGLRLHARLLPHPGGREMECHQVGQLPGGGVLAGQGGLAGQGMAATCLERHAVGGRPAGRRAPPNHLGSGPGERAGTPRRACTRAPATHPPTRTPSLLFPAPGRWIHVGPFQAGGTSKGCTDEDEKCEEWAVMGECECAGDGLPCRAAARAPPRPAGSLPPAAPARCCSARQYPLPAGGTAFVPRSGSWAALPAGVALHEERGWGQARVHGQAGLPLTRWHPLPPPALPRYFWTTWRCR